MSSFRYYNFIKLHLLRLKSIQNSDFFEVIGPWLGIGLTLSLNECFICLKFVGHINVLAIIVIKS